MTAPARKGVQLLEVSPEEAGQRLDNYLARHADGVPKTRVYRAIRKGEVRVNKGRSKPDYRVQQGDTVRLPPLSTRDNTDKPRPSLAWANRIRRAVVFDSGDLLVIDKPTGLAVHGGSGVRVGLIESLRSLFPEVRYLELVHRLDRDTSGLVLLAKNARTLRALHEQLREGRIDKRYCALVSGKWPAYRKVVSAPLLKQHTASGERIVKVDAEGKAAKTEFRVLERFREATLVEAKPVTGRTHQIRVHAQQSGHPILGDVKYQNDDSEALCDRVHLKRLFLHASAISFTLAGERLSFECSLDAELESALAELRRQR